jgi:hypothetical protein
VSGRFQLDLLRPGRVAYTWKDWFVGAEGPRRLVYAAITSAALLALVLVVGVLPASWRLSSDLGALPQLRRDIATSQNDLNLLRANLQALSLEARRHVRWGDVLTTFSNQTPPTLRIQKVEAVRPAAPGQPAGAPAPAGSLRVEALTLLRPGSPPLLDAGQFMAGLMRDPAMNRRYELRSWEIRPATPPSGAPEGPQYLLISVTLAERPS